MGTPDFNDIEAACLQIFTMCLLKISSSHANCIRVPQPRTGRVLFGYGTQRTTYSRKQIFKRNFVNSCKWTFFVK
jgi:hypothetical protein